MDNNQILIIIVITIITTITIIIGVQLIFLIKDLKLVIKKIDKIIKEKPEENADKKNIIAKKRSNIYTILNKINFLLLKTNKKSFDLKKNI